MQFHCTIRDGESETRATAGAITSLAHTVKRLEDVLQITLRHSGAAVANTKLSRIQLPVQSDFHGGALGSIANAIADHVFNRAAQEFSGAIDPAFIELDDLYFLVQGLGFKVCVVNDLLYYVFQQDSLGGNALRSTLEASQSK